MWAVSYTHLEGYFEGLIVKYLLENPHGSLVIIRPKRGLTALQDEKLKKKLAAYKEGLTAEERKRICLLYTSGQSAQAAVSAL